MKFELSIDVILPDGLRDHEIPDHLPQPIFYMGRTQIPIEGSATRHVDALHAWLCQAEVRHLWRPSSLVPPAVAAPGSWFTTDLPGLYDQSLRGEILWEASALGLRRAQVLNGAAEWRKCTICWGKAWMIRASESLHLALQRSPPGLFGLSDLQWVATLPAWDRIQRAGFGIGIEARPVQVEGSGPELVELVPPSFAARRAPWGYWSTCDACGRAAPRYATTRAVSGTAPGGMAALDTGVPVIRGDFLAWLLTEGVDLLPPEALPTRLRARPLLREEADADLAFLPPEMRGLPPLDHPPPPADRGTFVLPTPSVPETNQAEIEQGIYRNIYRALAGDPTDVDVLDLTGSSLTELPPEVGELANLRVLILRDNPVKSLPDEVFTLRNLTHVDLRDTPVAQSAAADERWGPRVTVLT